MSIIHTVLGPVSPQQLGVTLYHEHLAMKPGSGEEFSHYIFDDPGKMSKELAFFKNGGGGTIVEMSPLNFGRDIAACQQISRETGVHVICCTGFHKKRYLPEWVYSKSDAEIKQILINEINTGIDGTQARAGVIKIGTSRGEIFPIEERMISIVARVHNETNIPISTHCDRGLLALEQGKILLKNDVSPERVVFGHVDIPNDANYLAEICRLGFNVGIDHIGRDLKNHDHVKLEMIRILIEKGYIRNIFIAGDMGKRDYLEVYGGKPGFDYIVTDFKEYFHQHGMTEEQYSQILIENPLRFFQTSA